MAEQELLSKFIEEITDYKLCQRRQQGDEEYDRLNAELTQLSNKLQIVLSKLPKDDADLIRLYVAKHAFLADKDCEFVYKQGVKDCAKLLKQLGLI